MIMKHRGVYWRKQSGKFVVSFRSNGRAKTYGMFVLFEDAAKRAEEVWLTLPIAKRSQRVCDSCRVRMSNQSFDWGRSTCNACRKQLRAEPWNQWAKATATKLGKDSRRKDSETGWVKWARLKRAGICHRRYRSASVRKTKTAHTWHQWCSWERERWMSNCSRRKAEGWDRKTKTWVTSLLRREQDRLRKMSYET